MRRIPVSPLARSDPDTPHHFHIPVMGTGFTVDTPIRVARYGISSVISIADDHLLEQMREYYSRVYSRPYQPIGPREPEARVRRIQAYLDLVHDVVAQQVEELRSAPFEPDSDITRYFEMLPPGELRSAYLGMRSEVRPEAREEAEAELRRRVVPGSIDVNIMVKVDGTPGPSEKGKESTSGYARDALRGFALSRLRSSVVLSAGINRALFDSMASFACFFPSAKRPPQKSIILKVSDFRSARLQGQMLAKKGLWVSEFRVESGLNCGGHAFATTGALMGPVLEEFRTEGVGLYDRLRALHGEILRKLGKSEWQPPPARLSAQGGVGTASEHAFLLRRFHLSHVGWGTPFLLVPQATNVDAVHLRKLVAARQEDVRLGDASPLGVPFWNLRTSSSNKDRLTRIREGTPGSRCLKGFLRFDREFPGQPICQASKRYQALKLGELDDVHLSPQARRTAREKVVSRTCLCTNLAGGPLVRLGLDPHVPTEVCCGPNIANFCGVYTLKEMVDHIYGRAAIRQPRTRRHMFLKEAGLYVDLLQRLIEQAASDPEARASQYVTEFKGHLIQGLSYYHALTPALDERERLPFSEALEELLVRVRRLSPSSSNAAVSARQPRVPAAVPDPVA